MTVKDLKELLNGCNDDAIVSVQGVAKDGVILLDEMVFAADNGKQVYINLNYRAKESV